MTITHDTESNWHTYDSDDWDEVLERTEKPSRNRKTIED